MLFRALIFLTIFSLPGLTNLLAQNKYQSVLSEAKKLLEDAYFNDVIDTLTQYLTNGFSKEERKLAYRYLAHAYIAKDFLDKANNSIIELLYLHYNYEPDPVDDGKQFIKMFKELKAKLPRPPKKSQVLLEPIDFGANKEGIKWSHEFSKYLRNFFSNCDSIELIMKDDYQYPMVYNQDYFLLSGSGGKKGKTIVLDISLKELPEERDVWKDTVEAPDQRSLADSLGVPVAKYFDYNTRFVGFKMPKKRLALVSCILFALSSIVLHSQADSEKSRYRDALTSEDAKNSFNRLRAHEISRNYLGILSSLRIAALIYERINPRRPEFIKIERK